MGAIRNFKRQGKFMQNLEQITTKLMLENITFGQGRSPPTSYAPDI